MQPSSHSQQPNVGRGTNRISDNNRQERSAPTATVTSTPTGSPVLTVTVPDTLGKGQVDNMKNLVIKWCPPTTSTASQGTTISKFAEGWKCIKNHPYILTVHPSPLSDTVLWRQGAGTGHVRTNGSDALEGRNHRGRYGD